MDRPYPETINCPCGSTRGYIGNFNNGPEALCCAVCQRFVRWITYTEAEEITTYGLYQALKDEGFDLPEECSDVEMKMPVDGRYELHYVVFLTDDRLAQFGRALVRMAEKNME